ncbi:MAG: hypothetical protein CO137_00770 [Candidatus Magasanikbacteria bacterium CG_4_9_14_3_um_filter_32_9]|uniref:Uncharacterized protein n=1 Tax=Candidatus Magasanikbacteria bacterium CG_4_9_14_3_um_filter_32_9 TaxID=1974644 RepID=A0A2M7Z7G7_9BACT|nr:MAG: hypothetical protein CO137_00770 [Candidatus Magasanikbacteria bacterium CG_4_9_14_3_um_filter_32_9]
MITENRAKLFEIAEIAVHHSGGRLSLVFNEEDKSEKFVGDARHFLKLDGTRLGRDIELYGFMGDSIAGWEQTFVMFLEEVLSPLKSVLPESYDKAVEALRTLGESVVYSNHPENILQQWRELF